MAIVYQHRRLDTNEIFYIGIGKTEKRAYERDGRNTYWHRVVKKYDYIVEIAITDVSWEIACEIEKDYIKHYGRKDLGLGPLVNMTDGGQGTFGIIHSDESRKKMCKPKKITEKSQQARKKHGELIKGENNPMYGKKHSENAKEKMRIKVVQLDKITNNIIKIWDSLTDASKEFKTRVTHISAVCRGKRKTAGGFKWKYYED